jgi:ketosteroid isomerase-like protein
VQDPKIETVQKIYEAFGRGDADAFFACLTDDVDWATEAADTTAAPWFGQFVGKERVGAWLEEIAKASEVAEFTPLTVAANDTDVLAVVRLAYTVRATGRSTVTHQHHWYRFRDGKVCFYRGSEDTARTAWLLAS